MSVLSAVAAELGAEHKTLGAGDLERLQGSTETMGLGADVRRQRRGQLLRTYWQNPWVRLAGDIVAGRQCAAEWFILLPRRARGPRRRALLRKLAAAARDSRPELAQSQVVERAVETEDVEAFTEHPLLDLLDAGTTGDPALPPSMVLSGLAVEGLERTTLDLYGEAYYALIRDGRGMPVRWWPLPAGLVRTPRAGQQLFRVRAYDLPPEDVAWMRQPRPDDPYGDGTGLADAADHEIQIDESLSHYLAALLRNRARPDVLIMAPGLGETERERFEQAWRQDLTGPYRSGVAHFIGVPDPAPNQGRVARSVTVHDLARSPADLEANESRRARRDAILQVWRVPQATIGATESANRAVAREAERFIRKNRTIPDLEHRRSFLQGRFLEPYLRAEPEYPGGWILSYRLPALEDEDLRAELMQSAPYLFTHNALLEAAGEEPVDGGKTRYFLPPSVRITSDLDAEPSTPTVGPSP